MRTDYPRETWIDPRITVRSSALGGRGSFALAPIRRGEVVTIWGGETFTAEDVAAGKCKSGTVGAVAEDLFLAAPAGSPDSDDQFLNHCCDPNVWMQDEVTIVARRDIAQGEELTIDYATFEQDETFVMPWNCRCGSASCRRTITGMDWRQPELQHRYRGHFSPFIDDRIARLPK